MDGASLASAMTADAPQEEGECESALLFILEKEREVLNLSSHTRLIQVLLGHSYVPTA